MVTWVVEEGDSVSGGGARGRGQQLHAVVRSGATEEAGLRGHAPHLRRLHVAEQHSQVALLRRNQEERREDKLRTGKKNERNEDGEYFESNQTKVD